MLQTDTEAFDSRGLSARVEPAPLKKRIHLPKVRLRQVLTTEAPSFAGARPVRLASFADGRDGFRACSLATAKRFVAVCLTGTDNGEISAQQLSKLIEVSQSIAYRMLRTLRQSMRNRDRVYWIDGLVKRVNSSPVREFAWQILPQSEVRIDAFHALRVQSETHWHESKATPQEQVNT